MNNSELIVKTVHIFLRIVFAVALDHAVVAHITEKLEMVLIVGDFKERQLCVAKLKFKVTACCDFICIFDGFGHFGEQRRHFITGFYIKFIGGKAHAGVFVDCVFCGDADKNFLNFGILFVYVMCVVCDNKTDAELVRKLYNLRICTLLFVKSVVLYLEKIIVFAENIPVPQRGFFSLFVVIIEKSLRNFTGKTGGEAYKPLMVFFEQLFVNSGLCVEAFRPCT